MLNVGIIGLGTVAWSYGKPEDAVPYCHVGGIAHSQNVELRAVADLSQTALEGFTGVWGDCFPNVSVYSSSTEMLASENLDIVAVCVRAPFHFSVVAEVLKHRPRAIFLEKPPTCSLAEMDAIRDAARESGTTITVSYSRHWRPATLEMARLVREGLIGQVHTVVGYNAGDVLSHSSHTTDLLCQFAGSYQPVAVQAHCHIENGKETRNGYEAEPTLDHLVVEFHNGVRAIQIGASGDHWQFYADVFGTKGRVRIGMYFDPVWHDAEENVEELPPMPRERSVFEVAYDQIAAHLNGGPSPDCSEDAFAAVHEIGFGAVESFHANGRRIELPNQSRTRQVWGS